MSFYNVVESYKSKDLLERVKGVTADDVLRVLSKSTINEEDFLVLLSEQAGEHLELMAKKARDEHLKHFGRAVVLYTPMYISNYCTNRCSYCGFNIDNKIHRKKLTMDEIRRESQFIGETGLKHVLMLTGESEKATPLSYLSEATKILKEQFQSVAIEIFPMDVSAYSELIKDGVDGLAIYQETYNEAIYKQVHLGGPKRDYLYRLDAPERGCKAGMRSVSIGALLGLDDWRREVFMMGLHGKYLIDHYPDVEYSFSFPRIKPCEGLVAAYQGISDRHFVQIITALKLFLPYFGTNISTREDYDFRKNMLNIGISKMSAGVSTSVGGHSSDEESTEQFEISDKSDVGTVENMIIESGYQPVYKDWLHLY